MSIKNKTCAFSFSESNLAIIREKTKKAEMDMTKYITACALGEKIIADGFQEITSELKAIGRNHNQLTTLANMNRIHAPDLREVKDNLYIIFGVFIL